MGHGYCICHTRGPSISSEVMTMLKRLVIGAGLTLCAAACASAPPAPGATASRSHYPPVGCVTSTTATRLPMPAHECAGFGNVYTSKAIQSTGYTQVDQALSTLDPAVMRTGH